MAGWARKRRRDIDHPSTIGKGKGQRGRVEGDVYLAADDEPAILLGVVLGDVLEGEDL